MSQSPSPAGTLGAALGRIPSGLFVLTTRHDGRETGMLASWVQQAGFEPPVVSVALKKDRYSTGWVLGSGGFVLNQLSQGQKHLLRHFARGFDPTEPAFDALEVRPGAHGPILTEALAYLELEVAGHLEVGDHTILLGKVVGGAVQHADAEPTVHLRRDGFHY